MFVSVRVRIRGRWLLVREQICFRVPVRLRVQRGIWARVRVRGGDGAGLVYWLGFGYRLGEGEDTGLVSGYEEGLGWIAFRVRGWVRVRGRTRVS